MRESRDRRMFTPGARRFLSLRFIVGRGRRPGDFSRVCGDAPPFWGLGNIERFRYRLNLLSVN